MCYKPYICNLLSFKRLTTLSLAEDHIASVTDELMRKKHWWHDTDRGQPKYWDKNTLPSATVSTTNLTNTDPRQSTGLRGEKLATTCLHLQMQDA